ncbi:helix-turn-helix domain-containing protein [Agromyces sp. NPDC055658]
MWVASRTLPPESTCSGAGRARGGGPMEKSGGPLEGRRSDGEPVAAQTPRFDVVGVVLRVRRQLDLSQRDLARRLGVSHAAIARVEANRNGIDVADLERLVGLAGMRLAVLDESGAETAPIPPDWVRDNAGRRLPVHLDVRPPDDRPRSRLTDIHYDRAEPNAWYHHRAHRDERRARGLHAVSDDGRPRAPSGSRRSDAFETDSSVPHPSRDAIRYCSTIVVVVSTAGRPATVRPTAIASAAPDPEATRLRSAPIRRPGGRPPMREP